MASDIIDDSGPQLHGRGMLCRQKNLELQESYGGWKFGNAFIITGPMSGHT